MAFKTLTDLSADQMIKLGGSDRKTGKKNPTQIEGYFLGSRAVETSKGAATIHVFQTPKGSVGVWGKTDMNNQLGRVPSGAMTRVSFTGMVATKNGEMYKYKTEVDADNTIEVETSPSPLPRGSSNDDYEESEPVNSWGAEEEDDGNNNGEEDYVPAKVAASSDRKAKVEALLSRKAK